MSLAQIFKMEGKEEGRIEGRAEGKIEGRAEVLRRLIRKRFGIDILPHQYEEMLKNATEEQLDPHVKRILHSKILGVVSRNRGHESVNFSLRHVFVNIISLF